MGGIGAAGGDHAEISGVEQTSAYQASQPGFAFARAIRPAEGAQTGFGRIAAVIGGKDIIGFTPLDHWETPKRKSRNRFFGKTLPIQEMP